MEGTTKIPPLGDMNERIPQRSRGTTVFIVVVLASLLVRLGVFLFDNFSYDDAFITLRYAENFVRYGSFVYNPGEVVYGASSPLYTLILAALSTIVPDAAMPGVMQWLGVVFLICTAWLVYRRAPFPEVVRLLLVMALLSYPRFFYASLGGMEECFIVFLMVWSLIEVLEERYVRSGILLGLLFVTKIDTVLWIGAMLLVMVFWSRRGVWRAVGAATGVAIPWIVYSVASFSTVIPHTVAAKRVAYPLANILALREILKLSTPEGFINSPIAIVVFGVGTNVLLLLTIIIAVRRSSWWIVPFPLYCFAYTLILVVSGTSSGLWDRWTVPMWACLFFSMAYLGTLAVPQRYREKIEAVSPRTAIVLALLIIPAFVVPVTYEHRRTLDLKPYQAVGSWLRDHTLLGDRLMLEPIGIIGYRSQMFIHDFIGLVSPDVTAARESSGRSDSWYAEYLRRTQPEYVILRRCELESNRFLYGGYGGDVLDGRSKPWFDSTYIRVNEWQNSNPAFDLVLFRREKIPVRTP